MQGWLEDLRYAWRSARRRPGRSLVVGCGLALGLGANVAVFSYLDFLLWAELPARAPERLVWVEETNGGTFAPSGMVSYPDYLDYRDRNRVLSGLAAFATFSTTVETGGAGGSTLHAWGQLASGDLFPLLGVEAQRGRTLAPDDDRPGAEPVAVLAASFWHRALDDDPRVLGQTLRLNGHPVRIVGIMPERFLGTGFPVEIYMPLTHEGLIRVPVHERTDRRAAWLNLIGRLRPGVSGRAAQAALGAAAAGVDRLDPRPGAPRQILVSPAGRVVDPATRKALLPAALRIQIFVGLLLLLACANVASLLLANAVDRRHDLAVRVALGASRGRLVRQLLAESLLLALLGGAAGLWLASQATRLIERALNAASASTGLGSWGNDWVHLGLNPRVAGFSLLLCLGAGLLSGLLPAVSATLKRRLLSSQRGAAVGEPGRRFTAPVLLVVLQVAMSAWLLAATGFLARSVWRLERTPAGFDPADLLLVTAILPEGQEGNGARQERVLAEAADLARTLPGDAVPFRVQLTRSLWNQRMSVQFLAVFGALGLALAGLGLGSAMSFSVSRRTREIGIRMALGSTPGGVQSGVLRGALAQVAAGVGLGLAAAFAFVRLVAGLVEGTETTADPLAMAGATLLLLALGLGAAWVPARRAARIDPCLAFRAE